MAAKAKAVKVLEGHAWPAMAAKMKGLLELRANPRNARKHPRAQLDAIKASLLRFGWTIPLLEDETGMILAGHGRWEAASELAQEGHERFELCPVITAAGWSDADKRAYALADNQLALTSEWDSVILGQELEAIRLDGSDLGLLGFDASSLAELFPDAGGGAGASGAPRVSLRDRFGIPPFSVLDARAGWWQDRKRAWIALGIESEIGRGGNLLRMSDTIRQPDPAKRAAGELESGTSIFDPVLTELAVRWFSPPKGTILDPFAGGSVRGIVSARLGRKYVGVDLRAEQVEANRAQGKKLAKGATWLQGDSSKLLEVLRQAKLQGLRADMVLSCPPYGDLERYSDDPRDLSTMKPADFVKSYAAIIDAAVSFMAADSFAVWVVGEVRIKGGGYLGLVPETIKAFEKAGARFYNEAILVTPTGNLAMRARKGFETSRKLGKSHQNVLIFCKGDPEAAARRIGEVEFDDGGVKSEGGEETEGDPASTVKVSAAMARLEFMECGPVCNAHGCSGKCCDAPSKPEGCFVTIQPDEELRIEALGGDVQAGLLQPKEGERGCPFKVDGLCSLHESGEKPWGCIASPFTLNPSGTLIIRNRYRLLPCYKNEGPKAPAYRTFRSSLVHIFGEAETARLEAHLDAGGGDIRLAIDPAIRAKLLKNDDIRREAKALGGEV